MDIKTLVEDGKLTLSLEYADSLYKKESIDKYIRIYTSVIASFCNYANKSTTRIEDFISDLDS